jgi:hypothetical protein
LGKEEGGDCFEIYLWLGVCVKCQFVKRAFSISGGMNVVID